MLEPIEGLPDNVIGVRAVGEVEDDDYEDVLAPTVADRLERHDKVRLLYVLGADFTKFESDAVWEDLKLGVRNFTAFERIALVTDAVWMRRVVKAFGWLMPGDVELFHVDALDSATEWVSA